jgi:hypothetical protein
MDNIFGTHRPAELAWPGRVRRRVCMNELEGWAAGEAAAQRAATSARQHLRTVPGVVENAREKALRTSGTRSGPVGRAPLGRHLFSAGLPLEDADRLLHRQPLRLGQPPVDEPVPLENRIPYLTWAFSVFRRFARIR